MQSTRTNVIIKSYNNPNIAALSFFIINLFMGTREFVEISKEYRGTKRLRTPVYTNFTDDYKQYHYFF